MSAQGLSGCIQLRTLLAANNRLAGPDALADLAECKALITLDLQENQLSDSQVQSCNAKRKLVLNEERSKTHAVYFLSEGKTYTVYILSAACLYLHRSCITSSASRSKNHALPAAQYIKHLSVPLAWPAAPAAALPIGKDAKYNTSL